MSQSLELGVVITYGTTSESVCSQLMDRYIASRLVFYIVCVMDVNTCPVRLFLHLRCLILSYLYSCDYTFSCINALN